MTSKENIEKGREAERRFQQRLDNHKIPYLYVKTLDENLAF